MVQIAAARSTIEVACRSYASTRDGSNRRIEERKTFLNRLFVKAVEVKPNEVRALWLGFAFHFIILTAYYIVKPIRDAIAAGNRIETLPWMFTATLGVMLVANVIFASIVARTERRKFIPFAYAFFI